MGDTYRASTRYYRDSEGDYDDERLRSSTITRYKVTPKRASDHRYDRSERIEVEDDRRSRFSGRASGDPLDERRSQTALDRPRSDYPQSEQPQSEYSRPGYPSSDLARSDVDAYGDRSRSVYYDRDVERDFERDVRREPDRPRAPLYYWDQRSSRDVQVCRDEEVKVERKLEERVDEDHGHEVELYRKETEYFVPADPTPPPVIIRQQAPEPQKIIVQEAPSPAPIVLPRQQLGVVVLRDRAESRASSRGREPFDEDYYYRHDSRAVGPYRADGDYTLSRHRSRRRRDDEYSCYSDDDDYYVRRTVVRRNRSESSHRHRRELAEGALAGAGISALISSRRDEYGDLQENQGRKVLASAALGALGTEALRRAHSAYEDRWDDGRESPEHHSTLRKGLGFAAVALAAAGAAKYYQSNKIEKEEAHRGTEPDSRLLFRRRGRGIFPLGVSRFPVASAKSPP